MLLCVIILFGEIRRFCFTNCNINLVNGEKRKLKNFIFRIKVALKAGKKADFVKNG